LPTSHNGAKAALNRTATIVKEKLRQKFQLAQGISITTDIWSDSSRSSYLGITAHICNEGFSLDSKFSGLKKLEEKHKAVYVQSVTEELLATVELSISQVNFIVTDNGSNMIASFKEFIEGNILILLKLVTTLESNDGESDESGNEEEEIEDDEADLTWITSKRISCIDHSLVRSLTKVLNTSLNDSECSKLIEKVKKIVRKVIFIIYAF